MMIVSAKSVRINNSCSCLWLTAHQPSDTSPSGRLSQGQLPGLEPSFHPRCDLEIAELLPVHFPGSPVFSFFLSHLITLTFLT